MQCKVELEQFKRVVETIRKEFPNLQSQLILEHPHVEATLALPAQTGLNLK
jgi:hypothetical protein